MTILEHGLEWDPPVVIDGRLCDGRWTFACACGRRQGYAPCGSEAGGVNVEEALAFGWVRNLDVSWTCPICKSAEDPSEA